MGRFRVPRSTTRHWPWSGALVLAGLLLLLPAIQSVHGTGRVTTGQVVLYTFHDGSGPTVQDVSGVGSPLDLTIRDPSAVRWLPGGGLALDTATILTSSTAATKVLDAVQLTDELTLEAWVKPANLTQVGPARIVTISEDRDARNVTLGQGESTSGPPELYDVRLRTTDTSSNGLPSLSTAQGTLTTDLTHVVFTRESDGTTRIYQDGLEVAQGDEDGDFSDWDDAFFLALGNELGGDDRPWLGEFRIIQNLGF